MTGTLSTSKSLLKDLAKHTKNVATALNKFERSQSLDDLILAKVVAKNCSAAFDRAVAASGYKLSKQRRLEKKKKQETPKKRPRGLGL